MKCSAKWGCAAVLAAAAAMMMAGCSTSARIDQSQTAYASFRDLHGDGISGQTFTAGRDGQLVGVRLLVSGAGFRDGPYGSAVRVDLRTVAPSNVVSSTVVAAGHRTGDGIEHKTPKWIEIFFDPPYYQRKGQLLAFTIVDLSGGGRNGWNDYGMMNDNPYSGGQQFHYFDDLPLKASMSDMAFETLVRSGKKATLQ